MEEDIVNYRMIRRDPVQRIGDRMVAVEAFTDLNNVTVYNLEEYTLVPGAGTLADIIRLGSFDHYPSREEIEGLL